MTPRPHDFNLEHEGRLFGAKRWVAGPAANGPV